MKTTGVLPEALAASICAASRSEMLRSLVAMVISYRWVAALGTGRALHADGRTRSVVRTSIGVTLGLGCRSLAANRPGGCDGSLVRARQRRRLRDVEGGLRRVLRGARRHGRARRRGISARRRPERGHGLA